MNDKPIIVDYNERKWCISKFKGRYYIEEVLQPSNDFEHVATEETLLEAFRRLSNIIERGL